MNVQKNAIFLKQIGLLPEKGSSPIYHEKVKRDYSVLINELVETAFPF